MDDQGTIAATDRRGESLDHKAAADFTREAETARLAALAESLGLYTADNAAEDAFARIMVLGPAKAGKTTCIALSAPKPLIINCDGLGATHGASAEGASFLAVDATSRKSWVSAVGKAKAAVEAGLARTVIVDTVTLLADSLLDEISLTLTGWDIWAELNQVVLAGVKQLLKLDAHLFVVAHMTPDADAAAGILPAIGGKLKVRLPALMHDWILLDVEPGRKPERQWLLGPQKHWNHSGRNIRRSTTCDAVGPALFAELGIKP